MLSDQLKKKLYIAYIFLFIIGTIFVAKTLNEDIVEVEEKESKKETIEIRNVDVSLVVPSQNKYYRKKLKNVDSVLDLLELTRREDDFWYEKTAYIYGTEINNINRQLAPEGYHWVIVHAGRDITYEIADYKLKDDTTYELKLVPIRTEEQQ